MPKKRRKKKLKLLSSSESDGNSSDADPAADPAADPEADPAADPAAGVHAPASANELLASLQAGFSSIAQAMKKRKRSSSDEHSSSPSPSLEDEDLDSDYDSADEVVKSRGDRWDEDSSSRELQLRAITRDVTWVDDSAVPTNATYSWSKRIVAFAKFGFLQNEKDLVTALAKHSKKAKTEDDNAGMAYVRPLPSSKKLTTDSYREIDRFSFVRNSDVGAYEPRSLAAFPEVPHRDRVYNLLRTPSFPGQVAVGWQKERNPSPQLQALAQASTTLSQTWRLVAFGLNEVLKAFHESKVVMGQNGREAPVSEKRAKRIGRSLESALHLIGAQMRATNSHANKILGVDPNLIAMLQRSEQAGRGAAVDSVTRALYKNALEVSKNEQGASPRKDGAPGSRKRRKKKRKRKKGAHNKERDNADSAQKSSQPPSTPQQPKNNKPNKPTTPKPHFPKTQPSKKDKSKNGRPATGKR